MKAVIALEQLTRYFIIHCTEEAKTEMTFHEFIKKKIVPACM